MRRWLPIVFALCMHVAFQIAPAWAKVAPDKSGRDFASYYYALQVALDGHDPYDTKALSAMARKEKTRTAVHPFFYPPPYLLSVSWAAPLTLKQAYIGMMVVNEVMLAGCLVVAVGAFGVPTWAALLLISTYTPIPDNMAMGQANLVALLPAMLGLAVARRNGWAGGVLVGIAGMLKMSPALFLLYWALRRQWKPIVAAAGTAVALSLLTLPLVSFADQLRFYTEILPGFSSGDYHGLTVPISLEANHSIPDLYDRLFPTKADTLSSTAQAASSATMLALLGLWGWVFRKPGHESAAIGALTVLMVVSPVYTYEHHLVFLLLAIGAAAELSVGFGVVYFFLAWSLTLLRSTSSHLPDALHGLVRESKFLAEAGLFVLLCLRTRAPRAPSA